MQQDIEGMEWEWIQADLSLISQQAKTCDKDKCEDHSQFNCFKTQSIHPLLDKEDWA